MSESVRDLIDGSIPGGEVAMTWIPPENDMRSPSPTPPAVLQVDRDWYESMLPGLGRLFGALQRLRR